MVRVIDSPASGGPRGISRLEVLDNTHVRAVIEDNEGKKTQHNLEYPQGVGLVKFGNWQLQTVDDVYLQLTDDQLDIRYIRPRNGRFYVTFSKFGAEPGELPTIRWKDKGKPYPAAQWENPARYYCFGLYEVLNPGMYQGMEIMDILTYEWEWDDILEEFTLVGSERKRWHDHVLKIYNVFGFDFQNDDLHYVDPNYEVPGAPENVPNVLPELQDILRSRNKIAEVTVENGWVQDKTIEPGPFGMTKEGLLAAMSMQSQPLFSEGVAGSVEP